MAKKKSKKTTEKKVPVVTILGHVDHGKTTILDKIRSADVQGAEAGGITQKTSIFTIDTKDGNKISFIDTPGHEAFDLMRSRGGSVADIVLLIVAADAGIKPQTEESIKIIKKGKAKPIVVINKIDLAGINLEKTKREIAQAGMEIEGMGGDIPVVNVSGKTGDGIPELLEVISLLYEMEGPKKQKKLPKGVLGKAFVLESVKEQSRGNVSTFVLVQGQMSRGDWIGYQINNEYVIEKVKGVITEEGGNIQSLSEGSGGKVLGLSSLVPLGSEIFVIEKKNEKLLDGLYKEIELEEEIAEPDFSDFFTDDEEQEEKKTLKVVIKASSEGSLEALKKSLEAIDEDGHKVEVVQSGIGDVSQKDVDMAELAKAIILGFEVGKENGVEEAARSKAILLRTYEIIYKLVEEISDVITGMALPQETEEEVGDAEVKMVFTLSNGAKVLGCKINKGMVKKGYKAYVVRGDEIVVEGKIQELRHGKNEVAEMSGNGSEFGAILNGDVDEVQEGDLFHCFKTVK